MKNNKYKILVLSDLKESSKSLLTSTVSLAKMVGGDISLFHVTKPSEVVERDNQLSAMRSISKEQITLNSKIENLLEPINKDFGLDIKFSSTFGNLKNEIETCIKTHKPDIIVLGKRKAKTFNFIGDNLIDTVLKNHKGTVLIASGERPLQPNQDISLGVFNKKINTNTPFNNVLIQRSQQPIKLFTIKNEPQDNEASVTGNNTVEYVFDNGTEAFDNISKYASKSNINLMFIDNANTFDANSDIKNIINKVNVSVLLAGEREQVLQD
ncbi:universal stress protein [Lacinutrix chionoecetis]